eukprot:112975-Amorphochlora_amoeboformis.AAC.4
MNGRSFNPYSYPFRGASLNHPLWDRTHSMVVLMGEKFMGKRSLMCFEEHRSACKSRFKSNKWAYRSAREMREREIERGISHE